jgi:hypothetical protein
MKIEKNRSQEVKPAAVDVDLSTMPLKTLEDYREYNREARKQGRPVRIPPSELHKQLKVKFQRFDQPENVLKVRRRSAEIDFTGQLKPGGIYTLPKPIVDFLNGLAEPIYAEVDVNDGGTTRKETKQVGERSRFSCQVLEYAA